MMNHNKTILATYHFCSSNICQDEVESELPLCYRQSKNHKRRGHLEIPFAYFIFSIFLFSCYTGDKIPPKIVKPKEMGNIMWDIMRAQSLASQIALKDSTVDVAIKTNLLSQKVFEIYKTDSAKFNKSYNWYVKHPDLLKSIFDSIYSQKQKESNLELKRNQIHHQIK